jgi:hypothetical protein
MNRPHAGAVRRQCRRCLLDALLAELGRLDATLVWRAARASAIEATVAIRLRFLGLGRHGSLRGDGVFPALGKNLFDLGVRAGNDMY